MDQSGNKIDSTVTHLLMYTKELLHTLEQWAYGSATEEEVSDVYVKLGNEFNHASRSFVEANVDISDLGDVPNQLRQVLERALGEPASQKTLDNYLPSIREIVVTLLKQLKHKQTMLRQHNAQKNHARAASNASSANSVNSSNSKTAPKRSTTNTPATTPSATEAPYPPSQSPMRQPSERKDDPLSQLQKSQALERRASKRYSSYHMVKIMNGDQSTSLPTSAHHATHQADFTESNVIEERSRGVRKSPQQPTMQSLPEKSPNLQAPQTPTAERPSPFPSQLERTPQSHSKFLAQSQPLQSQSQLQQQQQQPQKTTVFLRLGTKVRKGALVPQYSLAAIRLLFIDLFGFTPKAGETFPDLTIQDHDTGVEYELTEATLSDIRNGSLICLTVESEEDLAVDAQIKELVQAVQDLSTKVDTRLGIGSKGTPALPPSARFKGPGGMSGTPVTGSSVSEKSIPAAAPKVLTANTDSFRQEFAVMRQICNKTISSMRQDVKKLQSQISDIKTANAGTNRGYMTASQKKLTEDTQKLISWVDDLQDIVESQRKDVASHGVRLSQRHIDGTGKSILKAHQDLRELQQYIAKENPTWVKTWETELNTVVEEQQFFKLQEQLVNDLESDLQNAKDTFELVEQCAVELLKTDIKRNPLVIPQQSEKQGEAKDELLGEIAALKPNHNERAEAIERAERLRKRELEMRSDDFKQELGDFVEEGKLKKSGGLEEVERRRKERDEMMREEQIKTDAEALRQKELAKEARRRKREEDRAAEQAEGAAGDQESPAALGEVDKSQ